MSYLLRMFCVCAAAFFLVHLALSLFVRALVSTAEYLATRLTPASGACMFFGLRLLPVTFAILTVTVLCVPSYLIFEQDAIESVGLPCLLLACLCVAIFILPLLRTAFELIALVRFERKANQPIFALVGFIHPRLLISPQLGQALTTEQMQIAVLHEEAHRRSLDNWKRFAMMLTPGLGFAKLEARWAQLAEWAADDAAVEAEPLRAVALAEAMVRVARVSSGTRQQMPISLLVADKDELSVRVRRLLAPCEQVPKLRYAPWLHAAACLGVALIGVAITNATSVLSIVHDGMEHLVH